MQKTLHSTNENSSEILFPSEDSPQIEKFPIIFTSSQFGSMHDIPQYLMV